MATSPMRDLWARLSERFGRTPKMVYQGRTSDRSKSRVEHNLVAQEIGRSWDNTVAMPDAEFFGDPSSAIDPAPHDGITQGATVYRDGQAFHSNPKVHTPDEVLQPQEHSPSPFRDPVSQAAQRERIEERLGSEGWSPEGLTVGGEK